MKDTRKHSPARKGAKLPETEKTSMLYTSERARARLSQSVESEDALFMSKLLESKNIEELD